MKPHYTSPSALFSALSSNLADPTNIASILNITEEDLHSALKDAATHTHLQLHRDLSNLQIQILCHRAVSRAILRLTAEIDAENPETARRSCMTVLHLAGIDPPTHAKRLTETRLHSTGELLPKNPKPHTDPNPPPNPIVTEAWDRAMDARTPKDTTPIPPSPLDPHNMMEPVIHHVLDILNEQAAAAPQVAPCRKAGADDPGPESTSTPEPGLQANPPASATNQEAPPLNPAHDPAIWARYVDSLRPLALLFFFLLSLLIPTTQSTAHASTPCALPNPV